MKEVTVFEAEDGTLFKTSDECEAHDRALGHRKAVETFLESEFCRYKSGAQVSIVRQSILDWEEYKLRPTTSELQPAFPPKKRGRPKKVVEAVAEEPVKRRGRPRKVEAAE